MNTAKNTTEANKPVFEARLNQIRVSVWENAGENGHRWYNTAVTRHYLDGDDWKQSTTFSGLADLTLVAEAIRLARNFIAGVELQQTHEEL